jgi:hypothetical protein
MVRGTFFRQDCPICGRPLEIRVVYLGRKVVCGHCHGELVAADRSMPGATPNAQGDILRRAEALLGRLPACAPRAREVNASMVAG